MAHLIVIESRIFDVFRNIVFLAIWLVWIPGFKSKSVRNGPISRVCCTVSVSGIPDPGSRIPDPGPEQVELSVDSKITL